MITPGLQRNALYALQRVFIQARAMAHEAGNQRLAALLDYGEYLPRLMYESTDHTETFRGVLEEIAERYSAASVLRGFDGPPEFF